MIIAGEHRMALFPETCPGCEGMEGIVIFDRSQVSVGRDVAWQGCQCRNCGQRWNYVFHPYAIELLDKNQDPVGDFIYATPPERNQT